MDQDHDHPTTDASAARPPTATANSAKRSKIGTACRNCRERKTRCDGRRPICVACERRQVSDSCSYEKNVLSTKQAHIVSLEDRLQRLEGSSRPSIAIGHVLASTPTPEVTTRNGQDATPLVPPSRRRTYEQAFSDGSPGVVEHAINHDSFTIEPSPRRNVPSQVDGLATVGAENDVLAYGDSSTIAFARQVFSGDRGQQSSTRQNTWTDGHTLPSGPTSSVNYLLDETASLGTLPTREDDLDHCVLPLRRNADNYLDCFWNFVHPLFPALHRTSFTSRYERLWDNQGSPSEVDSSVTFIPTLNLVFALGCQFSDLVRADRKSKAAAAFYARSRSVLHYDILSSTHVAVIQWLLLNGVYLQSANNLATSCWTTVGLAVRLAQNLGLHLEPTDHQTECQLNREMRRRVWHTCVVLDRLLAMTFGRPVMIPTSFTTTVPAMVDDEYLCIVGEGTQPPASPTSMSLFVYSCSLFNILADILCQFYTSLRVNEDMLTQVLSFNGRLDLFFDALPQDLKPDAKNDSLMPRDVLSLQRQVLHCRFLYTRLLSLRPLLLKTIATCTEDSQNSRASNIGQLDGRLTQQSCILCVTTAHHLIETTHAHLDTLYKSSGWHSVYFTFASATILLASTRFSIVPDDKTNNFELSWNRCFAILKHYEKQIKSAPRAAEVLRTLRQQVQNRSQAIDTAVSYSASKRGNSVEAMPTNDEFGIDQLPLEQTYSFDTYQSGSEGVDFDNWFGQHLVGFDCLFQAG